MSEFTHFDAQGRAVMVAVDEKPESHRLAIASGSIRMQPSTLITILEGRSKKGDVLGVARLAGIMAAKRTSDLIPLCHPISLTRVTVEFETRVNEARIFCTALAECVGRTGVEMEALTAASVALLTIYDMCKALERGMVIESVRLLEKRGGKSGTWQTDSPQQD